MLLTTIDLILISPTFPSVVHGGERAEESTRLVAQPRGTVLRPHVDWPVTDGVDGKYRLMHVYRKKIIHTHTRRRGGFSPAPLIEIEVGSAELQTEERERGKDIVTDSGRKAVREKERGANRKREREENGEGCTLSLRERGP